MLESIITSKARIKLLLKFFLNPHVKAYLRELSSEFGGSTNAVRVELNRLVDAKLLKCEKDGRNKYYSANVEHPLYPEMHTILRKMTGIDHIHSLISSLGPIDAAYISGDYARGIDSGIIDLVLVGKLDQKHVYQIVSRAEELIKRKIRTLMLSPSEFVDMNGKLQRDKMLFLWGEEQSV